MTDFPKEARVRIRMRQETYQRIAKIAELRHLSVSEYLYEVCETLEEDYLTYHAFNASWHSTVSSHLLAVLIRLIAGKNFSRDILADISAHAKWQVGKGPMRPTADWSRPDNETYEAVAALIERYDRLVTDRLGDIIKGERWDAEDRRAWRGY